MTNDQDRLELLISRRLDGEISEADELELNKRLIRDPEAHQLAEAYERQDRAVGAVLREMLGGEPTHLHRLLDEAQPPVRIGMRRGPWSLAAAAALMFSIGTSMYFGVQGPAVAGSNAMIPNTVEASAFGTVTGADADRAAFTSDEPHLQRQAVSRDLIGVLSEDGRTIYLFERNRQRTTVVPFGDDL